MVRIRNRTKWSDPDPYQIEKQDPDPYHKGLDPQHCRKYRNQNNVHNKDQKVFNMQRKPIVGGTKGIKKGLEKFMKEKAKKGQNTTGMAVK
jgi:hypothetical protein